MTQNDRGRGRQQLTLPLLTGLALLTSSGPFAIDMYLPALPLLSEDLGSTESMAQLTLSGFVLGLAFGQLVTGPISDSLGRKGLLVGGAVLSLAAAVLAAVSPTIEILILARLLQGLGGGACVVLARAVIPDLARGEKAARAFALLMSIQGIAPILAPVVGGLLVEPLGWRGLFWILAALALAQLLVTVFLIRESKPAGERSPFTLGGILGNFAYVLRSRGYRGYLFSFSFGFAAMFAYISASPFVLQNQLGFSVQAYALLFGLNSVGLLLANTINARLIGRVDTHAILTACLVLIIVFSTALVVVMIVHPVAWLILPLLFLAVSLVGPVLSNSTALGTGLVNKRAGAASALMGFLQFGFAGLVSPLVGLGSDAGVSMAVGMVSCAVLATLGAVYAGRHRAQPAA